MQSQRRRQYSLWLLLNAAFRVAQVALLEFLIVHVHEAVHGHLWVLLTPLQQGCNVVPPGNQALLKLSSALTVGLAMVSCPGLERAPCITLQWAPSVTHWDRLKSSVAICRHAFMLITDTLSLLM